MSILREHGTAYLAMRRSLGYKLDGHGRLLMKFIGYLEDHGHGTVTTEAAMSWAAAPAGVTQAYQSRRLSVARCFARYLSAFDLACQVPPAGMTGPSQPRPAPYLYSREDISALIHAAGTLASPLQAATFQALISLLAVTGMRLSELAGLRYDPSDPRDSDIDLWQREITVRGKGGRPRIVKIGHRAARSVDRYLRARSRHAYAWRPQLWLGVNNREPLTAAGIYQMTARRGRQAGVDAFPHRFRHHFSHTWLDRGGPEGDLMELAGWTSPQMLARYGASARSARSRRTYDRIMTDT